MNTELDLNAMEFTDLQDIYTTRCEELGKTPDDSFKTKEALIEAINALQAGEVSEEEGNSETSSSDKQQKYNSSGKRGPNQGIGAFAKEQIAAGKTNPEILEMIRVQFPTARTSTSCIAYYRNAIKKGGSVKGGVTQSPDALRAKAKQMLADADALEKKIAEQAVKGDLETKIREEVEARIRAEVEARYAEILKRQAEVAQEPQQPAAA